MPDPTVDALVYRVYAAHVPEPRRSDLLASLRRVHSELGAEAAGKLVEEALAGGTGLGQRFVSDRTRRRPWSPLNADPEARGR